MNPITTTPAFGFAAPEIILVVGALALLLLGAWRGERATGLITAVALVLLAATLLAVLRVPVGRNVTMSGAFISDGFARFMKLMVLISSAAGIALSTDYMRQERISRFEYPILILLATVGMMMMVSANDLIGLYLGLELLSLPSYVLASIHRDDLRSTEAGLKYFVLGALSSGMLLYGASLVYGFTGTVSFPAIASTLTGETNIGIVLGLVFVSAGIAFKVSAAPFHMWTPDVYEGSPTPVTAFFAAAPKVAAMALAVRLYMGAFPGITPQWQQILVFVSLISMALGSFAAIGQRNIKRLMAYSAIANIGYALLGLAAGTQEGVQSVVLYMAIYIAMSLGAFACILAMRRAGVWLESIEDLSGVARTHPALAFCLAAMMWSLAGLPPFAGFIAKFYVFVAAVNAGLTAVAVIAVIISVVGAFYYLRITKVIYFDDPRGPFEPLPVGVKVVLAITTVVVVVFGLVPYPLVAAAATAARSLF